MLLKTVLTLQNKFLDCVYKYNEKYQLESRFRIKILNIRNKDLKKKLTHTFT